MCFPINAVRLRGFGFSGISFIQAMLMSVKMSCLYSMMKMAVKGEALSDLTKGWKFGDQLSPLNNFKKILVV